MILIVDDSIFGAVKCWRIQFVARKKIHLMAMADRKNNFLSYLDLMCVRMRPNHAQKYNSVHWHQWTLHTHPNRPRTNTHKKKTHINRHEKMSKAFIQRVLYYCGNVTIILDWQKYVCVHCNFLKKVMTLTNHNTNRSKSTLIYIDTFEVFFFCFFSSILVNFVTPLQIHPYVLYGCFFYIGVNIFCYMFVLQMYNFIYFS